MLQNALKETLKGAVRKKSAKRRILVITVDHLELLGALKDQIYFQGAKMRQKARFS